MTKNSSATPHPASAPHAPEDHPVPSRAPATGSKRLTVAAGAAMGIGSAALVAALLYANHRAHRGGRN